MSQMLQGAALALAAVAGYNKLLHKGGKRGSDAAAPSAPSASASASDSARSMALAARNASRQLASFSTEKRTEILMKIADALEAHEAAILSENAADVAASQCRISDSLMQRLILKPAKIQQLAEGIRSIARQEEPLARVLRRTELAEDLVLEQVINKLQYRFTVYSCCTKQPPTLQIHYQHKVLSSSTSTSFLLDTAREFSLFA
jgi:hypothetical protein